MATDNFNDFITIQALEALDTHQYQAIALDDGKIANNGGEAIGIIYNRPKINEFAQAGVKGVLKFRAGGAVTGGKAVTVTTSGYFTAAGSDSYIIGRALETVTSGSIGKGLFDFTIPAYACSSSFAW